MTMFAKIGDTVPAGAIVTDSDSHGVYYHMPEKKDPRDPGNWRDGDDAMGTYKEQMMDDVSLLFTAQEEEDEEREVALHGLSYQARLRDQFAMHIINGMLAKSANWSPKELALRSYEYADAMMVAREMKR